MAIFILTEPRCEKFHAHDFEGGPTTFNRQIKRRCQEYNGYLHDEKNYVLCHHHVYLAMNRQLWGQDYGLALSAFNHSAHAKRTIGSWMYKIPATTFLQCEARIVDGKFILHAMYTLSLSPSPRSLNRLKTWSLREVLASSLPQIVSGHRDCNGLHTGMAKMLAERLNSTSHDNPVHSCEECATDFTILSLVEEKRTIWIEVWRDLGTGRNPFDSSWRAHGANGEKGKGFRGKTGPAMPGLIKEAFEGERVQDNMGGLKPLLSEWNVAKPRDMEVLQGFTAIRARCEELKRDIEQLEKQCYRVRRKLWEANS